MENNFLTKFSSLLYDTTLNYSIFAIKRNSTKIIACKISMNETDLKAFFSAATKNFMGRCQNCEVKEYPQGTPKTHIEFINTKLNTEIAQSFKNTYQDLKNGIVSPETNNTDISKYKAYVICLHNESSKNYFITCGTPLKTSTNSSKYYEKGGVYKPEDKTYLQLRFNFDCIVIDDIFYFTTVNAEKLLGLNDFYNRKTKECIELLKSNNIIDNEEIIKNHIKGPKWRSLGNYQPKRVEMLISDDPSQKIVFEQIYGIPFIIKDSKLFPDISDVKNLDIFIKIITNKLAKDFTNEIVESTAPFSKLN